MIIACSRAGDIDAAEEWFSSLRHIDVSKSVLGFAYNALIDGNARVGDISRAEEWLESLFESQADPSILSFKPLIELSARLGEPKRAERFFHRMETCGIKADGICYHAVISA